MSSKLVVSARVVLLIVVSAVVGIPGLAHADPPDGPGGYSIILGDPAVDSPVNAENVAQANATFDRRASRILRYAGCFPQDAPNTTCHSDNDCVGGPCQVCPSDGGACAEVLPGQQGICQGFLGVFNSQFPPNLEAWGRDALAKLAYPGPCGSKSWPGTQTATGRYAAVDNALLGLTVPGAIPDSLVEGTTQDPETIAGTFIVRQGDLDTGVKELIPILYLYPNKIPQSYAPLVSFLEQKVGGPTPYCGNPPYWTINNVGSGFGDPGTYAAAGIGVGAAAGSIFGPVGAAIGAGVGFIGGAIGGAVVAADGLGTNFVPETENHSLLELSNEYLINQLFNQTASAGDAVDNSTVHKMLLFFLHGILTTDFFEYNAKPYQHYALYAMENLSDFAQDSDVQQAAQMVLDWAAEKFAISSSLVRRAAPYRRRGSKDGNFLVGTQGDEQVCRFYLYSGQLQSTAVLATGIGANGSPIADLPDGSNPVTLADGGQLVDLPDGAVLPAQVEYASDCMGTLREAIGKYRVPDAILDTAFKPNAPYFQITSGGTSYYSTFYANTPGGVGVPGSTEIYDNEGPFMILGGGIREPHGLPDLTTGGIAATYLDDFGGSSNADIVYSTTEEDIGISLPILLLPNDPDDKSVVIDPFDPGHPNPGIRAISDRLELVRIEGTGHQGSNLCVGPGFACGKNPTIPKELNPVNVGPGDPLCPATWQFVELPTIPTHTYVAMLCQTPYLISLQAASLGEQPLRSSTYSIGLFEAAPASNFGNSFTIFQQQVMNNNPANGGIFAENNGSALSLAGTASLPSGECLGPNLNVFDVPCNVVLGWSGTYLTTQGTHMHFQIPIDMAEFTEPHWPSPEFVDPETPVTFGQYPISSPDVNLPDQDPTQWDLAQGEAMTGNRTGAIIITDVANGERCQLNMLDPQNISITGNGCGSTCSPTCTNGFPCTTGNNCLSKICGSNGLCQPPACSTESPNGTGCATGAACGANFDCASGLCPAGACVASGTSFTNCSVPSDCHSSNCGVDGTCKPASCAPDCQFNAPCGSSTDCASGVCTASGTCGHASCFPNCANGAQCADSSDCGSKNCDSSNTHTCLEATGCVQTSGCTPGAPCGAATDCASQVCSANSLCEPASCSPTCPDGHACGTNADCDSRNCQLVGKQWTCLPPGGCPPQGCQNGARCGAPGDCASGLCSATGTCLAPSCAPNCPDQTRCANNGDCASSNCANGTCTGPTPSCSPACPVGEMCTVGGNCASGNCQAGHCATAGSGGSSGSSGGTGGAACASECMNGSSCVQPGNCASFTCTNGVCLAAGCTPNCQQGAPCGAPGDCGSKLCVSGKCAAPKCSPTCASGSACNNNGDCASFVCQNSLCK